VDDIGRVAFQADKFYDSAGEEGKADRIVRVGNAPFIVQAVPSKEVRLIDQANRYARNGTGP